MWTKTRLQFLQVSGAAAMLPQGRPGADRGLSGPSAQTELRVSGLLETLRPLLARVKFLNAKLNATYQHDEETSARYHELAHQIGAPLQPLMEALVDAGLVSASFYDETKDECYAWFEVDRVGLGGTIDFGGHAIFEVTDPAPSLLPE